MSSLSYSSSLCIWRYNLFWLIKMKFYEIRKHRQSPEVCISLQKFPGILGSLRKFPAVFGSFWQCSEVAGSLRKFPAVFRSSREPSEVSSSLRGVVCRLTGILFKIFSVWNPLFHSVAKTLQIHFTLIPKNINIFTTTGTQRFPPKDLHNNSTITP